MEHPIVSYTTKEVAEQAGIHPNTVRFYEEVGLLTPPKRQKNGYRAHTELQLAQCRLIRLAMQAEVLQNGLRKKAVAIVRLCAALDFDRALAAAVEYRAMIAKETAQAQCAAQAAESMLHRVTPPNARPLIRLDAAKQLGVTPDTLRNWERNGLIRIWRLQNGYRMYTAGDIERLQVIRTLRLAGYSLSSILRLMNQLDGQAAQPVEAILNIPEEGEEIVSVCDQLIVSLKKTARDAAELERMLNEIKAQFQTIQ